MSNEPVQSKEEVIDRIDRLAEELDSLGVERLGLFGSFQRDEANADSDIDLLVEFRPDAKSYRALFELDERLEEQLGRGVELVTPASLDSEMRAAILEDVEYVAGRESVSTPHSHRT